MIDPRQDSPKPDGHARRKLLHGAFSRRLCWPTTAVVRMRPAPSTVPAQTGYTFKQVPQYVVLCIDGTGQLVGAGATGTGAP